MNTGQINILILIILQEDNLLEISSNGIVSNVGAEFNEELKINGDLIVSTGITPGDPGSPDVDKIAVSADTQGTIVFKYADELGGTAPIGTIIFNVTVDI